jgi:hypothetical protein
VKNGRHVSRNELSDKPVRFTIRFDAVSMAPVTTNGALLKPGQCGDPTTGPLTSHDPPSHTPRARRASDHQNEPRQT